MANAIKEPAANIERAAPRSVTGSDRAQRAPALAGISISAAAATLIYVRWGAWLIAAVYVFFGSRSTPVYTQHEPALLIFAFIQTLALMVYPAFIRPFFARRLDLSRHPDTSTDLQVLGLLDFFLALLLMYFSGGWGSPFYHFALTSVVVPAFLFRPAGAALLIPAFAIGYVTVLATTGPGMDGAWSHGSWPNLFAHLASAALVVGGIQFLSHLARDLSRERDEKEILAAQEERSRIAREIHDGVAQSIYMLSLNLEHTVDRTTDPALRDRLSSLGGLAKTSLLEVRQYIFDLKPLISGETSLLDAIRSQLDEFRTISGLQVDLEIEGAQPALPVTIATSIYRVVQEGLANALRHAEATRVLVSVTFSPHEATLSVVDNGKGFDGTHRPGNGLSNMRQRIATLDGSLGIESTPGEGTRVLATIPLPPKA